MQLYKRLEEKPTNLYGAIFKMYFSKKKIKQSVKYLCIKQRGNKKIDIRIKIYLN